MKKKTGKAARDAADRQRLRDSHGLLEPQRKLPRGLAKTIWGDSQRTTSKERSAYLNAKLREKLNMRPLPKSEG
jgi:hypothetical protein